jgi:hypothetical protein
MVTVCGSVLMGLFIPFQADEVDAIQGCDHDIGCRQRQNHFPRYHQTGGAPPCITVS